MGACSFIYTRVHILHRLVLVYLLAIPSCVFYVHITTKVWAQDKPVNETSAGICGFVAVGNLSCIC